MRKFTGILAGCLFAAALLGGQTGGVILNGFGDSITQGAGSTNGATSWFTLVTLALGWIPNNEAVGGAGVYDMSPLVYAQTATSTTRSIMDIGQNDGAYPLQFQSDWLAYLEANYLWLLTPNKVLANSVNASFNGNWSADDLWPSIGEKTATPGSTMTFSIFGTSAYIVFGAELNSTVTAAVSVDGGAPISVNPATRWVGHNGATISPYALRIAGLSYTVHTVVVTASNIGNTPLRVLWAAGNSGQLTSTGPYLYTLSLYQTSSLALIFQEGTNADVLRANQELSADGLGITFVDINAACYSTNLTPLCNQADGTHPNDAGQEIFAKTILGKINSAAAGFSEAPGQPTVLQTSSDFVSNNALIVQSQSGSSACFTTGANGVLIPGTWDQISGICSPGGRISLGTTDSAASLTVRGNVVIEGIGDPPFIAVGPYYGVGTTTYSYVVVAVAADGSHSAASAPGTITDGAASFSYPVGVHITRYLVPDAVSYDIYRVVGGNSQGKIGNTSAADFYDWGAAGDGTTPPLVNTSGQLTVNSIATARPIQGTLYTPASSSSPCAPGVFADDDNYHYVCTSLGVWKRVALSPF